MTSSRAFPEVIVKSYHGKPPFDATQAIEWAALQRYAFEMTRHQRFGRFEAPVLARAIQVSSAVAAFACVLSCESREHAGNEKGAIQADRLPIPVQPELLPGAPRIPIGRKLWERAIRGSVDVSRVTVDADGSVIVVGSFRNNVTFEPTAFGPSDSVRPALDDWYAVLGVRVDGSKRIVLCAAGLPTTKSFVTAQAAC